MYLYPQHLLVFFSKYLKNQNVSCGLQLSKGLRSFRTSLQNLIFSNTRILIPFSFQLVDRCSYNRYSRFIKRFCNDCICSNFYIISNCNSTKYFSAHAYINIITNFKDNSLTHLFSLISNTIASIQLPIFFYLATSLIN